MQPVSKEGVILSVLNQALRETPPLANKEDIPRYIIETIRKCDQISIRFKLSPNQIGRCRGDWFEYVIANVLAKFLRPDEFRAYPGRGHTIRQINGFKDVVWIPMPDAIVRGPEDFRALLSLKWGLRHDRMYEVGYEAYAVKDWIERNGLNSIKALLVTADISSGYESRLETMSKCPVIDSIYFVHHERLSPKLKSLIKPVEQLVDDLKEIAESD